MRKQLLIVAALLFAQRVTASTRYDIDVAIDPATRSLRTTGTMELHDARVLRLRSGFALSATNATVERGETEGEITTWHLRGPLPRVLRFTASSEKIGADLLYIGDDVAFGTANEKPWYPIAGSGASVGDVRYHVPAQFVVAAPGREVAKNAFRVSVPIRFWFAAGPYSVQKHNGTAAYLLRARPRIDVYLDGISRILAVLSREFGPYRYGRFMLVEVPESAAIAAGGFNAFGSAGGIVTRSGALERPFNIAYYAHEVGHQWWSNLISLKQGETRGNYLMDEAMAQFASMRAVEAIEGPAAAARYRSAGYPGFHDDLFCYCAAGYFRSAAAGLDRPLIELPDDSLSDRLSRNKGGLVWSMWADAVGRDRFSAILRRFTRAHAFGEVTLNDFVHAIGHEWLQAQWLERTGAPELTSAWEQHDDSVKVDIIQKEPFYRFPLQLEFRGADRSKIVVMNVKANPARATFQIPFKVLEVVVDPRSRLLRWTPEMHAEADAAGPYLKARELINAGKLAEAEEVLRTALKSLPENDPYAARFLTEYRLGDVLARLKRWAEARPHVEAAIAAATRRPEILPYVYLRYAMIAKELNDAGAQRQAVRDGLSAASVAPEPAATDAREALLKLVQSK